MRLGPTLDLWLAGGGNHQTADQSCVWLFGCRSKSMGAGLNRGL